MDTDPKINEPEPRGGIPALLRAVAALAVLVLAAVGVLVVLEVIPHALREWGIRLGLVFLIVAAAAVAIGVLARGGRR